MFRQWIRYGLILTAMTLFAVGCTSTQAAPISSPTTASAPSSSIDSTVGTDSSGDSVRLVVVPGKSEARYRVREQLVSLDLPSDAIGRTQAITGTIVGK